MEGTGFSEPGVQSLVTLLTRCQLWSSYLSSWRLSFLIDIKIEVRLPVLPNKNTGCLVKFEFQINNFLVQICPIKYLCSVQ